MVTSSLPSAGNNGQVNPSSLLTISKASDYCRCHPQTLRSKVRQNRLKAYRIGPTGWLRFDQGELSKLFGIKVQKENIRKKVCILGRVSSDGQKEYLQSQLARLTLYVKEHYGEDDPLVFSEVCSAFGNRTALYKCVDAIIDGKVDVLVVEYRDRLSRTSALTNLVKHLCKRNRVEIVYVEKSDTDPKSINASLEELVEFTTHISAKQNGLKSAGRNRLDLSPELLKRAYELKKSGMSERGISNTLFDEGFKHPKNGGKIDRSTIGRILRQQWQVLSKMYGDSANKGTSFEKFAHLHISKDNPRPGRVRRNKVSRKRIQSVYSQWCVENQELEIANGTLTKKIDELFSPKKIILADKSVVFENLSLLVGRSRG